MESRSILSAREGETLLPTSRVMAPPPVPTAPIMVDTGFNPRTEVSADAKYITTKITRVLVGIFIVLPAILGIVLLLTRL